jgi:galactose mutarotase-like enzyme
MGDHSMTAECSIKEITLERAVRALYLENDLVALTILLDKGADIYELIYKPKHIDVLWKSPWGLKAPGVGPAGYSANSETVWLEHYAGGWQELFPNGGDACLYKGVELSFHGEASMIPWDYTVIEDNPQAVEVRLSARLRRSPFSIERRMRLEQGRAILTIHGKVTNEAGESMDYMWSHHPAFGAPFLSRACRIDVGAQSFQADDLYVGTHNPLSVGQEYHWPNATAAHGIVDMSQVPAEDQHRDTLAYLKDFDAGWYAITNTDLGLGIGLVWPKLIFPYAWLWQEINASPGFPFYQNCYVMAIEPATSIPGQGLNKVIEKTGFHRSLKPGESAEVTLRAVFYESRVGVSVIQPDGIVLLKQND